MPGVILQEFLPRLRLVVKKAPRRKQRRSRRPCQKRVAAQTYINFTPPANPVRTYELKPSQPKFK